VVGTMEELGSLLPDADFVALTCPLTAETENLIDAEALSRMKPAAHLVNVARGRIVDEAALIEALETRRIAGAGIDVTAEEPQAPGSPLWAMEHVLITPHTAGETRRYEDNVIEILRDNLGRIWQGEQQLRNQVV
jgi:phosphoglycerate dehydrogenase-like enzyme